MHTFVNVLVLSLLVNVGLPALLQVRALKLACSSLNIPHQPLALPAAAEDAPSRQEICQLARSCTFLHHMSSFAAAEDAPKTGEICRQARAELDRLYQSVKIVKRDMPETNMSLLARLSPSQQVHHLLQGSSPGLRNCAPGLGQV